MRISIIHDWVPSLEQELTWKDGLAAAIKILHYRHEVKFFTCGMSEFVLPHEYFPIYVTPSGETMKNRVDEFNPDVILFWSDMTREHIPILKQLGKPMAVAFAGGNPFGPHWALFDHIFVESNSYLMKFQNAGLTRQVSTAFGTNTKLFDPIHAQVKNQAKIFDVCFPATYCDWKRHHLFADAVKGRSSVCAGFKYEDHETYCWDAADQAGALSLPHVSAETLRQIYASSRLCVITSHWTGGSQRTVLEAMAMNLPIIVMSDSDKTSEYVIESGEGLVVDPNPNAIHAAIEELLHKEVKTRDYIMSKWTEQHYVDALESGLMKIV